MDAVVHVPGSKSLTNRWLVLAALADGPCTIRRPLRSRDSERMVDALRGLGCHVDDSSDEVWSVVPAPVLTGGVPTGALVLAGDDDPIVPLPNARLLAARIPGGRLQVVHRGGHLFVFTHAAEIAASVRRFLDTDEIDDTDGPLG